MLTYYIPDSKECPIQAIRGIHFEPDDNIVDVIRGLFPFMSGNNFAELRKILNEPV